MVVRKVACTFFHIKYVRLKTKQFLCVFLHQSSTEKPGGASILSCYPIELTKISIVDEHKLVEITATLRLRQNLGDVENCIKNYTQKGIYTIY